MNGGFFKETVVTVIQEIKVKQNIVKSFFNDHPTVAWAVMWGEILALSTGVLIGVLLKGVF